jgi:hypothetical protein
MGIETPGTTKEGEMLHFRVRRPGHTTVVAYLSLFLVLTGGTALAFKLKANKVKSKHIAPDAVLGEDVNEATLGKIPSAQHADTADQAGTADTAGTAAPSGPAGGALAGAYPNPSIGSNAVGAAEIQNPTRSVNLPLPAFLNRTDQAAIDFGASNGISPDLVHVGGSGGPLAIEWDDDSDGPGADIADIDGVETTHVVPPDYASNGRYAFNISKDGHSGPAGEFVDCLIPIVGGSIGLGQFPISSASLTTYVQPPPGFAGLSPGDSMNLFCEVHDGTGNTTANDAVRLHSIEFRYTATQ